MNFQERKLRFSSFKVIATEEKTNNNNYDYKYYNDNNDSHNSHDSDNNDDNAASNDSDDSNDSLKWGKLFASLASCPCLLLPEEKF